MARYSEYENKKDYKVAPAFRDACVLGDLSLLYGNTSIWTSGTLPLLDRSFVAPPDGADSYFIVTSRDQISKTEQNFIRFAAEIL